MWIIFCLAFSEVTGGSKTILTITTVRKGMFILILYL